MSQGTSQENKYLKGLFGESQYVPPSEGFNTPIQEENFSLEDLKSKAINKALMKKVKQSWLVKTSYALPISLTLIALALGMSLGTIVSLILGSLTFIGLVRWIIPNFFLFDSFEKKYRKNLQNIINQRNQEKRLRVKENLQKLGMEQGASQFNEFLKTFNSLVDVLNGKFKPTELTYTKYYIISQQVLEAGMNNLLSITNKKITLNAIDSVQLKRRINGFAKSTDPLDIEERNTLQERLDLYNSESQKIERLLVENEKAITQMTITAKAISEVDTVDLEGKRKMDEAMLELRDAVQRLADYHLHELGKNNEIIN